MKKLLSGCLFVGMTMLVLFLQMPLCAQAKEADTIKGGIYAGDIPLEGLTADEASAAVTEYVDSLKDTLITLESVENQAITVTAEELGIYWSNTEMIEEALLLGTKGNVIERYKALKDLEHENQIFDIEIDFSVEAINTILVDKCTVYDRPAKDYSLRRENGQFMIEEGQTGYLLDVEMSIDTIYDYMVSSWDRDDCRIKLVIEEAAPRGDEAMLSKVGDLLGSYTTVFNTSGAARTANVTNGCKLINGMTLYPGDEFSMMDTVTPFTQANGYYPAGSYLNGRVVDSVGGGICQVSTTLYNAILLAELDVTERYNHSMVVNYVEPAADAAIAESADKDFKFVNSWDYPIYIEGITTPEKHITFNIYGVETRPANRTIRYESKILSTIQPDTEVIVADAAQPLGAIQVQGAYIGYKSELWKVVLVDGVETGRTKINSSSYKMVPRTATVGVATADPNAYNEIIAAIGTNSIDHVINVAAYLQALTAPVEAPPVVEEPAVLP